MITLINDDNTFCKLPDQIIDLVYADMIYENFDPWWIARYHQILRKGGIFIAQTDYHSVAEVKILLDGLGANFVNWLVWKNEWGNFRKDRFRQCHDDILIYSRGKEYTWHPEKAMIPKVTANAKGLNPSGRLTKLAGSVITDICLTTVSKERIKLRGKNIQWQKPYALLHRVISPFVDPGYTILDPFMGTGTSGLVAINLDCNYIGIERDSWVFELAKKRLEG